MLSLLGSLGHDLHVEQPPLGNTCPNFYFVVLKHSNLHVMAASVFSEVVLHPESAVLLETVLKRHVLPQDGEHPPGHGGCFCPVVSAGAAVVAGASRTQRGRGEEMGNGSGQALFERLDVRRWD